MEFTVKTWVVSMVLILPGVVISYPNFVPSRATYYGSPDCLGTPRGACGYGEFGRNVNDANVAGVSRLYKNGTGCGGCYQVKCTSEFYCSEEGVMVVVTDHGEGDSTDFILSERAFARLARLDMAAELFAYGVVDVEYRRVPCHYSAGYGLVFKVHEHSSFPNYLAIVLLYQSGINDVVALQMWQEECKEWVDMRRAFGAVYDMASPPRGDISLRFQLSGAAGLKWVQAPNVIPNDWKAGVAYDSSIQL